MLQVACGASMNALLTAEGQLFTWGKNYSNQLGFKDIIEKVRNLDLP
jgi:alpha-tubulin suppressor-like RCC1 family protein